MLNMYKGDPNQSVYFPHAGIYKSD